METPQPKLRVFAGPNGAGKSTVINFIRNYEVNGRPVNFGYYINADDIAQSLKTLGYFSFEQYDLIANKDDFNNVALESGLLNDGFNFTDLIQAYEIVNNSITEIQHKNFERLSQITADYLRKKLLEKRQRFSFETVFSHSSKLDVLRLASNSGYKIYLYFVATESPEINKFRVEARTKKGGHDVPPDKITSRYYRALDLMYYASQFASQAFFFDNSEEGKDFKMFAHFKMTGGKKVWDTIVENEIPNWFRAYYSEKIKS